MKQNKLSLITVTAIILAIMVLGLEIQDYFEGSLRKSAEKNIVQTNEETLKIISSSENENLENIINEYAKSEGIDLQIEYAGTLDIMEKLNAGQKYDAVWTSNSIWLYMLNDSVKISDSKATSINPVVFAVKNSKAEELGFKGTQIYTKDIVDAIKKGDLKFSMSNPTRTNTGATAYLGLLSTIAGNPEVLKEEDIENSTVKEDLKSLFTGLERSSGSEDFLEELFLNGDYEAVVSYESSIINMNKTLAATGKETLYVLYPVDGVSISDSPFAYINNGDDAKREQFLKLRNYILSDEGQRKLAETGRRTWYGGVSSNAPLEIFNPDWGIDTKNYIVPLKFPNTSIIQKALSLYQSEFRKPIHAVFGLDYSGSMQGSGVTELKSAMNYILNQEEAQKDLLQFTEKDKITVIPFSTDVIKVWDTKNGAKTDMLIKNINSLKPGGSTNIYDTSIKALDILNKEDSDVYNFSVILMTDGLSNMGEYSELEKVYSDLKKDIPIYSIMFGSAVEDELQKIADLTNAKVFDGKSDLLRAFKEVRGYN